MVKLAVKLVSALPSCPDAVIPAVPLAVNVPGIGPAAVTHAVSDRVNEAGPHVSVSLAMVPVNVSPSR